MEKIKEIAMINMLKSAGLSISAIARREGCDRKTVRKYLLQGAAPHKRGRRRARLLAPW